jgi:hypothetical protein
LNAIGESLIFSFEIAEIKPEKKDRVFLFGRYTPQHIGLECILKVIA